MPGFIERDVRVDFCRGLALIFIFLDHIRDNRFALLTMHKFGLSDAAEVFVLLAGFSAALAYGPTLEARGFAAGARKALRRVRAIYIAHLSTLAVGAVLVAGLNYHFRSHDYVAASQFEALVNVDWPQTVIHALILSYQPDLFNILPLYIVLLTGFPIFYRLIEKSPSLALASSLALWVVAMITHVNLSSEPGEAGWYFDPLAWQLLFVIGVVAGYGRLHGWNLSHSPLLSATAAVVVVVGFVVVAPWTEIPGWQNTHLIPQGTLGTPSKTYLSAWRLLHILALTYLFACTVAPTADWLQSGRLTRALTTCGRHSLDVFCLGIVLSIVGGCVIQEVGRGFFVEFAVSAGGIALMCVTATWLARGKQRVPTLMSSGSHRPSSGM